MQNLFDYLLSMGGLHDSELRSIEWSTTERRVVISIGDLYANFEGLPEYKGEVNGEIVLSNVTRLDANLDLAEKVNIFEMLPREGSENIVVISLSPTGRIEIEFGTASHPE